MARLYSLLFIALGLFYTCVSAQDYTCGPDKPCKLGCCSNTGICGYGPTFCSAGNCTSSCDAKSECNPGFGSQWSAKDKCPLNVCCSEFGFCGTTEDFCGDAAVKRPSCSGKSSNKRTIAYYEGWSQDRSCDQMAPEEIPIGAYSHINFAFAFIDPVTFKIAPMAENQVELYKRTTRLKELNPDLQVWIAVGGWSMNDPDQPTATTFSDLAASTANQQKFFSSLISFMETYGFDGVDVDWEYPVAEERSGIPADFDNAVTFLQNLRKALGASGHKYGLTITIPSSYWYLQHFDIVKMAKTIDWFNLMSYDLHGTWDATNKYLGPYVGAHTNLTEIEQALDLLWRNDIDPGQVVLGLGFYGRSFTLADPGCSRPGCVFTGGANAGECTNNVGTLSYAEIRRMIDAGASVTLDETAAVKMVTYGGNQWVSYDDEETLRMKIDFANRLCLGGSMVWAADLDNREGEAAAALAKITGRQVAALSQNSLPLKFEPSGQCFITSCYKKPTCPSGWGAVQQTNGNVKDVDIGRSCPKDEHRTFCCPADDMPTCRWTGSAPSCGAGKHCTDEELELTYSTNGCVTGHKKLCCTRTTSNIARDKCAWKGTAPICTDNKCPSDKPTLIAKSINGDGQKKCDFPLLGDDHLKSFCCEDPSPYTGCVWYTKGDQDPPPSPRPLRCDGKCPAGKELLATDGFCFGGGERALCCDTPGTYNNDYLTDFKNKLQRWIDDPICPADQIYIRTGLKKRDELAFASESNATSSTLSIAAPDVHRHTHKHSHTPMVERSSLKARDWKSFGGYDTALLLFSALRKTTYIQELMVEAYDMIVGQVTGLSSADLDAYMRFSPAADDFVDLQEALCEGQQADEYLDYLQNQQELCLLIPGPSKRSLDTSANRDLVNNTTAGQPLNKRMFLGEPGRLTPSNGGAKPTTGAIMQAVIDNRIPLLYMANLAYRPAVAGFVFQDTELEVVYDIRGHPDLQQTPADIFAVFHFHTDGIYDNVNDGQEYPSISNFLVYHGQRVFQNTQLGGGYGGGGSPAMPGQEPGDPPLNGGAWRVDFRDMNQRRGRNARRGILDCREDENGNRVNAYTGWQPGNPRVTLNNNDAGLRRVHEFGRVLRERGILHPRAYPRWNGVEWNPRYGDTNNFGAFYGPAPADMGDGSWPT